MTDDVRSSGEGSPVVDAALAKAEKRKLLERLLREKAAQAKTFPLSFAQERLWFLDQLAPGQAAYNMPSVLRLQGALDTEALEQTFNELVKRHETLRTRFRMDASGPVQIVMPPEPRELPVVDLRSMPKAVRESEAVRRAAEETTAPFDLSRDLLIRAVLLRLDDEDHVLVLVMHHIVSDGWSMGVLVREFGGMYAAFAASKHPELPELPIQYADFARWQRERLQGERMDALMAYWRKQLAQPTPLELPADRPRPAVESFKGAMRWIVLPDTLSEDLAALSRRENATLFMTMLAAFNVLLYRYTSQEDLVIGSPIANRNRKEVEGLIGFFVNMLTLRVQVRGNMSFLELLTNVRGVALDAYEHQDMPFEKLVDDLAPERDLSRNPLFQVVFAVQNAPMSALELPGLRLRMQEYPISTTRFDIELHVWEAPDGLTCRAIYSTDLFDEERIDRLLAHFQRVLEGIVEDPDRIVGEIPLLLDEERHWVVDRWNATDRTYAFRDTVVARFTRCAAAAPDAVSVACGDAFLTYAGLDARSNALARQLRDLGAARGMVVAVAAERSLLYVTAVLSVLKTGAAYLPIDPAYPKDRACYMVSDAGVSLVVSAPGAFEPDWVDASVRVLVIPDDGAALDAADSAALDEKPPRPDDTAYVIYTSGSTGRPKGVAIQHASLTNLVEWHTEMFGVTPQDRATLLAGVGFDASVWELWPYLATGASVHVTPESARVDTEQLRDWLVSEGVTISFVPTPLTEGLINMAWPAKTSLRRLLTGGDRLHFYPPAGLPFNVFNNYGPTEGTVVTTAAELKPGEPGEPPIGAPIANVRTYVLDACGAPCPIGVWGELCVGGKNLSPGYWRHPELTKERFTASLFFGRLYRTGDRVRWRADGQLEFGGRLDRQVKIRGYRIELGEIERVLGEQEGVREAVVEARAVDGGDVRLTGFVVLDRAEQQAEGEDGYVDDWAKLYEETYAGKGASDDPTLNVVGWRSSYTGEDLPVDEMREWVEGTVGRIARLEQQEVLEIGCGTGMLLFRLGGRCKRYEGWDFSGRAIAYVRHVLDGMEGMRHVTARECRADVVTQEPARSRDGAVMNSVIQYFPTLDYLSGVLDGVLETIQDGGSIFVGDVRSLPLLEAYAASVESVRGGEGMTRSGLRSRVDQRVREEEELVIDPAFFMMWAGAHPRVTGIRISPKRGWAHNELTRFRYDVTMRVGGVNDDEFIDAITWRTWGQDVSNLDELRAWLQKPDWDVVGVRGIPDARLGRERVLLTWLAREGDEALGDLSLDAFDTAACLEPETLWRLADEFGCGVYLEREEEPGLLRAAFRRAAQGEWGFRAARVFVAVHRNYATDPLQGWFSRHWAPRLRESLRQKLPDYMTPSSLVVLDAMPLTAHGKIDRQALPDPGRVRGSQGPAERPSTDLEKQLAVIWEELLGAADIGVNDNFFDLGGHSLLATQVVSRVRELSSVDIPLRVFFETPTLRGLSLAIERARGDELPPLKRASYDGHAPVSFAQQRLWFLDQLTPGGSAYNVPTALILQGTLDTQAIERVFIELVARHETLRTVFACIDGEPVQVIQPPREDVMEFFDLSDYPRDRREDEARRLAELAGLRPFDLAQGPLFRVVLLRVDDDKHVLVLCMHHIISDGWSMGVLIHEMKELYSAFLENRKPALAELPIQYADFAIWQRTWLQGAVWQKQLAYWRTRLEGLGPLELPTDFPRPAVQSFESMSHVHVFNRALLDNLKAASQAEGATLFMTLLTAFKVLLWRYTGQEDIAVGSPIANRTRNEIEPLIGFFVNTLVMRTDLSGAPTFRDLLHRVRDVALGAYEHQDLPFEQLVEELNPRRDMSRNPLFQVMFTLQNAPSSAFELQGLAVNYFETDTKTTRFDLEVHFWEIPPEYVTDDSYGFVCNVLYGSRLFKSSTITRMVEYLHVLLESIAADPGQRIADLAWIPQQEQRQLLVDWNQTATDYPRNACIHALFEESVDSAPDAPALTFEGKSLTYGELNARANRLAHQLRANGVSPNDAVGLCFERGIDLIVATLGILKAGAAYLPLNPSDPTRRLTYMLASAEVKLVLTAKQWLNLFAETGVQTICLDQDACSENADNPAQINTAADLAYVMYTSGSTGQPKGVCVTHRNVVRLVRNTNYARFTREEVFLQFAPATFDAATLEIWGSLLNGAHLIIFRPETPSLADLGRTIADHGVTTLWLTAGLFHQMTETHLDSLRGVRQLLAGGDVLSPVHVRRVLDGLPDCTLINGYGPTECTTFSCCFPMTRETIIDNTVPIGKPVANARVYILDPWQKPVGIGVPGELYIGGDGVARGYLHDPERTAACFLPDPFSDAPEARMYRTGDQVRWREDGQIEFLGRLDRQVKVRGFRIELEEIETALAEHPGVREAAVITRPEPSSSGKQLVAYVVGDDAWAGTELGAARVAEWQALYDATYASRVIPDNLSEDFWGWNSSYTDAPIPVEEMREWVDDTVARIQSLGGRRLLEVGCGTGLLLSRLAPDCDRYVGTDFSPSVLTRTKALTAARPDLAHVELLQREANDFSGFEPGAFDGVVLNSIVQYFPSAAHLINVLESALRVIKPGGFLYVGDVRCLPLLEMYALSVELAHATGGVNRESLAERMYRRVREEEELVVDPRFFEAFATQKGCSHVRIAMKRGQAINELTQFRYAAVLRVSAMQSVSDDTSTCVDWSDVRDVAQLRARLNAFAGNALIVDNVPNARLADVQRVMAWLTAKSTDASATLDEYLAAGHCADGGIPDIEACITTGEQSGYQVDLDWRQVRREGHYSLVYSRDAWNGLPVTPGQLPSDYEGLTNQPLRGVLMRRLAPELRRWLESRIPAYMIPGIFVVLDALPLTDNGKVDRDALPAPERNREAIEGEFVAPRTVIETTLTELWSQLLGVDRVGVEDDFFALGGHSLLATQLISRVRSLFEVEISLQSFFESPRVLALAYAIENARRVQAPPMLSAGRTHLIMLKGRFSGLWTWLAFFALGTTCPARVWSA